MKYKVGDKVRVKSLEWYDNNYDDGGFTVDSNWFDADMSVFCGKVANVKSVSHDFYELDIDGGSWFWYDWMLEDEPTVSDQLKEKRFKAACFAMQGVIASGIYSLNDTDSIDDIVFDSYKLADELLKQGGFTE